MSCVGALQKCLDNLNVEAESKEKRTVIETLITLYRNILYREESARYRKVKIDNKAFHNKVWRFSAARQFMQHGGWHQEDSVVIFEQDAVCVTDVIKLLLDNRFVEPLEVEWIDSSHHENKDQLREEELKRKACEERKKELEEFLKDKKEREDLRKQIKAEHEADKYRRRYITPQNGTQLQKDAKVKALCSSQY